MKRGKPQNTSSVMSRLLGSVPLEEFLDDYFGKRPLFIKGAPGKFDALMKPNKFIYGLEKATEIRCVFSELRQATIAPIDVREMYEAGATICVTGMDRVHPSLRAAAYRIKKEIGYGGRVDFRAYLSPPGSGFDFHYDARVATSLQLEGTKTWWYSTKPHSEFPTNNSTRTDMKAIRRVVSKLPLRKVTLRPGDLLCLPAGVWHRAKAGRGGSLALNLAFNHAGATVLDMIVEELRRRVSNRPSCRQPFLTGAKRAPAGLDSHVDHCVESLEDALATLHSEELFARALNGGGRPKQLA